MEFGVDKIEVPNQHSFIIRKLENLENNPPRIHSHKNYELNYILSGSGRRIVGNHISSFEKGDLVLLGPDLPHCWEFLGKDKAKPSGCIVIHFYEHINSSNFFSIPELTAIETLLKKANNGILFQGEVVNKIKSSLIKMLELPALERYIELLRVFSHLLKTPDQEYLSIPMAQPIPFNKDLERINLVYEYVFNNIADGINQEEAAALLNMAPASFCRYFKKKTNRTFMQYVKSVRIGIAAKMLAETDKQITRICYESGYNNLANFNHQFRNIMDTTPTDYRKNFR